MLGAASDAVLGAVLSGRVPRTLDTQRDAEQHTMNVGMCMHMYVDAHAQVGVRAQCVTRPVRLDRNTGILVLVLPSLYFTLLYIGPP